MKSKDWTAKPVVRILRITSEHGTVAEGTPSECEGCTNIVRRALLAAYARGRRARTATPRNAK